MTPEEFILQGAPRNIFSKDSGINKILVERTEQIEKHHRTTTDDVLYNSKGQLRYAAIELIKVDPSKIPPIGWNGEIWYKMISKPLKERLIIAGALTAAEIDRLQSI